jgi:chromosome segregation ATPase
METNPIDPVFGSASYPQAAHPAGNGSSVGPASRENARADAASSEIGAIASAIEDLQSRLQRANEQLGQVAEVRTTEYQIGHLFVEAQRFSEEALSKLEMRIQEILVEAEAKATEILHEATEEAQQIRRQAGQSSLIPARTAQELQSAIVGFARVNSELVEELNALNAMLAPMTGAYPPPSSHTSAATGSF